METLLKGSVKKYLKTWLKMVSFAYTKADVTRMF